MFNQLKMLSMKKLVKMLMLVCMPAMLWSCYDDGDLWNKVNELEEQVVANSEDLAALSAIVDALNQGKVILNVEQNEDGYALIFSDGSKVEVKNGDKGEKGENGDSFFVSIDDSGESVVITLADGRVIELPKAYELRVLTFEDADVKFPAFTLDYANKEITKWSDLIDNPQYGGSLIYNDYMSAPYYWYDEGNTELYSELNGGGPYWSGGHAVSNYYMADYSTADYTTQLAVSCGSEGAAGHNGSANFAVHNGYVDAHSWKTELTGFSFGDNIPRVVDHLYIVCNSYFLHSLELGDGFNSPATDDTWVKVTAYGYDEKGNETGFTDFYLVNEGKKFTKEWTKWDLSVLGKVQKITFNIFASEDQSGSYGLNCPGYFAYDDVCVRFEN